MSQKTANAFYSIAFYIDMCMYLKGITLRVLSVVMGVER